MWQRLEGEFQTLEAPREPVRELQGMDFEEAPEEDVTGFTREEEGPAPAPMLPEGFGAQRIRY